MIRRTGTGELVPLYMPHSSGRRGWHMWVTRSDKDEFLDGRPEPLPGEPMTLATIGEELPLEPQPIDWSCHYGEETGIRAELSRARDDEMPIDASLWHSHAAPAEFSRPYVVNEFVIPGDLVAARRTFVQALAHCEDTTSGLPSGADIAAGHAEITDDQRGRLEEVRGRCRRLAGELSTHPWWETVGDRPAARQALLAAADRGSSVSPA